MEDLLGGGDRDYDDMGMKISRISSTTLAAVSEPDTIFSRPWIDWFGGNKKKISIINGLLQRQGRPALPLINKLRGKEKLIGDLSRMKLFYCQH
jgi:hypothetical protein